MCVYRERERGEPPGVPTFETTFLHARPPDNPGSNESTTGTLSKHHSIEYECTDGSDDSTPASVCAQAAENSPYENRDAQRHRFRTLQQSAQSGICSTAE